LSSQFGHTWLHPIPCATRVVRAMHPGEYAEQSKQCATQTTHADAPRIITPSRDTGACWAVGWAYSFCHQENQADRRKRQYSLQAQFAKASWIRGAFSYGIRIIALKVSLTGGGEGKAQLSTIQRALGGKAWIIEFGSPARNTEISVLSKPSGRRDGTEESSALTTRVGEPFVTSLEATRESLAAGPL
jgi:hypothetical protein